MRPVRMTVAAEGNSWNGPPGEQPAPAETPDALCFMTVERERNIYSFIYLFHAFLSRHLVQKNEKRWRCDKRGDGRVPGDAGSRGKKRRESRLRRMTHQLFHLFFYSKLHPFFFPFAIKKPEVNAHFILPVVTHSASH